MKAKTVKKRSIPKFLYVLKDVLVSAFSNRTVIDVGVKKPWWGGVIIALIGISLPVMPLLKMNLDSKGSDFISSYSYNMEEYLTRLAVSLEFDETEDVHLKNNNLLNTNVDFKIDENKELDIYVSGLESSSNPIYSDSSNLTPIVRYVTSSEHPQNALEFYYLNVNRDEFSKDYLPKIKELENRKITIGTIDGDPSEDDAKYTPSLLVFYKEGLYFSIFKPDTTTLATGLSAADWKNLSFEGFFVKDFLLKNAEGSFLETKFNTAVFNNWKTLFNDCYLTQKNFNIWFNMLIYLGIYAVLVIFMGLLLFLLTRGKNNMFNYYKFLDCQKMSWWASTGPALLALILGFIIPRFATMSFIVLFGLRVMWMSMKQLRPM